MNRLTFRQLAMGAVLAVAGIIAGANMCTTNQARGEVRGTPEPPTFQSGSVPILRDIAATLRQMDSRLARLETVAQKLQKPATPVAVSDETN